MLKIQIYFQMPEVKYRTKFNIYGNEFLKNMSLGTETKTMFFL